MNSQNWLPVELTLKLAINLTTKYSLYHFFILSAPTNSEIFINLFPIVASLKLPCACSK